MNRSLIWPLLPLTVFLLLGCSDVSAQPDQIASAAPAGSAGESDSDARRVEVAVIRPAAAKLDLTLPGEVEASKEARLASALGGYVEQVNVEAGQSVKRGQVLALVDSATHSARAAQAKVEVDLATIELRRAELLGDTLPAAQLDAAKARLSAAKAALHTMQVMVSRAVITAPFDGVIVDVNLEVGEVAAPGVPAMRLVKLAPVKVTVSLSDRDVLAVKEGMKVVVTTDARATLLEGTVKYIQRAADVNTRSFIAEIEVANEDQRLLPGMVASVAVSSEVAKDQVVIAQDWLVTKLNDIGVFVDKDGVAAWKSVAVGSIVRDQVVIKSGLAAGDRLVITGHRELAPKDKLIVARAGVCCTDGRVTFEPSLKP